MLTLFPRKALPSVPHTPVSVPLVTKGDAEYDVHGEADGDGRIEMPTGGGSTSDDSKSDTHGEGPANGEHTPKRGHAQRVLQIDGKAGNCRNTWKAERDRILSAESTGHGSKVKAHLTRRRRRLWLQPPSPGAIEAWNAQSRVSVERWACG